jgi:hypothetical protein
MLGAGSGSEFVSSALFLLFSGSLVPSFSGSLCRCFVVFILTEALLGNAALSPHGFWPRLLRDLVGAESSGKERILFKIPLDHLIGRVAVSVLSRVGTRKLKAGAATEVELDLVRLYAHMFGLCFWM